MKMTLFELKSALHTVGAQLQKTEETIVAKAADAGVPIADVQALKAQRDELKERFTLLQEQHNEMEAEQKAKLTGSKNTGIHSENQKERTVSAKAELVRAVVRGTDVPTEVKAALGDGNGTGGEKILPTTMTTELLHEPFVKNPLRDVSTVTSVTNLEIPKVTFTLDDDDFIADTETAKELEVDGDVVSFSRFKFKVFAPVSETILAATDTNLVQTVDRALESGLAAKEKKVAFARGAAIKTGEEHMSFYSAQNAIKEVSGATLYAAIKGAIADLHEDFRENSKVCMRYVDYMEIIETLANGNATLYQAQPEQILGKPVIFCDSAVDPIVGDFSYSHFNYDPQVLYDRDKDVKTGVWNFVLTAWLDHKIKLKSAFRIAKKS